MASRTISRLDKALESARAWLQDVQEAYDLKKPEDAYETLRVMLHMIRDTLDVQTVFKLGSLLPLVARGIYYEGYCSSVQRSHERPRYRLPHGMDQFDAAQRMFSVIERRMSSSEIHSLRSVLPDEIILMWPPRKSRRHR